jgi:putative transposase
MRKPRRIKEGATYHVIARTNRGETTLGSHAVKMMFLQVVASAKKRYAFEIVTLCLLDTHVHLMVRPQQEESLSRIMQWMLSVFAIRFNRKFDCFGHFWYDRFKSKVIESFRQFVATFNYVVHNPVKHGLVDRIEDYPYSTPRLARDGPPGLLAPLLAEVQATTERINDILLSHARSRA